MKFRVLRHESGRGSAKFLWILTVVLLIISGAMNFLLARKTRELRKAIAVIKSERTLTSGARVPPVVAQDLTGNTATIRFEDSDRPTLLYVFTPSCGWCKKNQENFKALLSQSSGKVRVIGLSLSREGLVEYVSQALPDLPVYTNLEMSTTSAYRFGGTPETILVSTDGRVLKVWTGAYMGETQRDIEDYFKIKLPGVGAS